MLRAGRLELGTAGAAFERAFADRLGCRHVVAVGSGAAALQLAFLAAGLGPGDEAIVPAISFVASANAALHCGSRKQSSRPARANGILGPSANRPECRQAR